MKHLCIVVLCASLSETQLSNFCLRSSSQSTSSSWVNGRSTTTTTLQFYVAGSSGRQALASVRESRSDGGSKVSVQV